MDTITTNNATSDDFEYCWKIYSRSIRDALSQFIQGGWVDEIEKLKFQKNWEAEKSHILLLNNRPVGWLAVDLNSESVKIEHGYIEKENQKKGIGTKILNFLNELAEKEDKPLIVEVLKNSTARDFFRKNGFFEKENLSLTSVMERKK